MSRQGVKETNGAQRLEIENPNVPEDSPEERSTEYRPLRRQTQHSGSGVLQLASQSGSSSDRCFLQCWKDLQTYAFPPFCLIGRCSRKVTENQGDPVVQVIDMVPSPTGSNGGDSSPLPRSPRPHSGPSRETTSPDPSTRPEASCVDSVVRSLNEKGVSDKTAELICTSWRKGTEKSTPQHGGKRPAGEGRQSTISPVTDILDLVYQEKFSTQNSKRTEICALSLLFVSMRREQAAYGHPPGNLTLSSLLTQESFVADNWQMDKICIVFSGY